MLDNSFNLDSYIRRALSPLDDRQEAILIRRFGLDSDEPLTLAEVGDEHKVTRERVRQISNAALKAVQARVAEYEATEAFRALLTKYLKGMGGVRRHDLLVRDLGTLLRADHTAPVFGNKIVFLFTVLELPNLSKEDDDYHQFWYLHKPAHQTATSFVDSIVARAKKRKEDVLVRDNFRRLLRESVAAHKISEMQALNYLKISKLFMVNSYGDFGLSHWIEIAPKTVRDKAYLVLKKAEQPIHFSEVAAIINSLHSAFGKRADHRTVHNELIKDPRFVLVGRGTYGLKEHGFLPGTARDVIARVLKERGPLTPEVIVEYVAAERPFKRNTILLNLQNKEFFKKITDGRYTLAK